MSALDSFWSIPIIQDAISLHLTQQDFWNCVQASHALHRAFIPHLWHTVARNIPLFLQSPGQPLYRHHVRTLSIKASHLMSNLENVAAYGPFPTLEHLSLDAETITEDDIGLWFLDFATAHPTLKSLLFRNQQYSPAWVGALEDFMATAAAESGHLRELSLRIVDRLERRPLGRELWGLLNQCVGLEKLTLDYPPGLIEDANEFEGMIFPTRIKDLTFGLPSLRSEFVLGRFLMACPSLERLQVDMMTQINDSEGCLTFALKNRCRQLKELILRSTSTNPEVLMGILQSCIAGLRLLEVWLPAENKDIVAVIIESHKTTLEDLDLLPGCPISMESLDAITGSCSALRELSVRVHRCERSLEGAKVSLKNEQGLSSLHWVCTQLLALQLEFTRPRPLDMDRQNETLNSFLIKRIYREIGRLSCLQKLIVADRWDVGEVKGMLVECLEEQALARLEDLWKFCFYGWSPPKWTQNEIGMMVDQWPTLKLLGGSPEMEGSIVAEIRASRQG